MLLPLLLVCLCQAPAPPPPPATFEQVLVDAQSRDILEVPAGLARIQEKTLPKDKPAAPATGKGKGGGNMLSTERGMRLLLFMMAPQEKLQFKLGGDGANTLLLSIARDAQPDGMEEEVARVNRIPTRLRTRELEIRNVTPKAYPALLRITGPVGLPYSLEVTRILPPVKPGA